MKADDINTLKQRIKNEMNRRRLHGLDEGDIPIDFGSLKEFTSVEYDFDEIPETNSKVMAEHGEKTINLLFAIADVDGVNLVKKGNILPNATEINNIQDFIRVLEKEPMDDVLTSCRGACSGLCFGSCIGECNGCSGECTSGCQGCSDTCGSGCATGSKR